MLWVFVGSVTVDGTVLQEIGGCSFGRDFLTEFKKFPAWIGASFFTPKRHFL